MKMYSLANGCSTHDANMDALLIMHYPWLALFQISLLDAYCIDDMGHDLLQE